MFRWRAATASSFHLWWALPPGGRRRLVEVGATLEVLEPPTVASLYFWALQVGFIGAGGRRVGAAHTGLQWHPGSPGGAVNWGGYHEGGRELDGTAAALPLVDSANTLRWAWHPGRPYRFRVHSPAPGRWRSEVTDVAGGRTEVLRDLLVDAAELGEPVCWSEVFAPCRAPSVTVRWSDLHALDDGGGTVVPVELRPTYQAASAGGCPNTESRPDAGPGVLQVSGLPGRRSRASGDPLPYPSPPPGERSR